MFHTEYPRKPTPPPKQRKPSSWPLWAGGVGSALLLLLKLASLGMKADHLYGEHDDGSVSRSIRVVLGREAVLDTVTSVEVMYALKRFRFPPPRATDTLWFEARVHALSWFPVVVAYHGASGSERRFITLRLRGEDCPGAVNCVLYADTALVECW